MYILYLVLISGVERYISGIKIEANVNHNYKEEVSMKKAKKMKRWLLSMVLILALAAGSLAGCGGNENGSSGETGAASGEGGSASSEKSTEAGGKDKEVSSEEPIKISVMTKNSSLAVNVDPDDYYFFHYLEYYMKQLGYNVELDVIEGSNDADKMQTLLGTGDLPDLVLGRANSLSNLNAVTYGANEGMLLDWTPYINDKEIMPNVNALLQSNPEVFEASTCIDGAIYALPCFSERCYLWGNGNLPRGITLYYDTVNWLEPLGLKPPETAEELIEVMRAFQKKKKKKEEGGDGVVYMGTTGNLEQYLWTALGFFGNVINDSGTAIAVKDGEVYLPAATEEYREYIELMHTMYTEGLIPQDYFTMDPETVNSMVATRAYPMVGNSRWGIEDYSEELLDWVAWPAVTAGSNEKAICSISSNIDYGCVWVSAETEHPEVIARMIDYAYGAEGYDILVLGPKEGEDPLGLVDGWYAGADGGITTKMMEDGYYDSWIEYDQNVICPLDGKFGSLIGARILTFNSDGSSVDFGRKSWTDAITGEEISLPIMGDNDQLTQDNCWRKRLEEEWALKGHLTTLWLPGVFFDQATTDRTTDLKVLIKDYVTSESVNFITGVRPLEEIDQFFAKLQELGVEEYVEYYREAYSNFLKEYFD